MRSLSNKFYIVVLVFGCVLSESFLSFPCSAPPHRELWELPVCRRVHLEADTGRGEKSRHFSSSKCFRWHLLSTFLLHSTITCQTDLPSVVPAPLEQVHNGSDPWGGPRSHAAPVTPPAPFVPPTLGERIPSCTYSSLFVSVGLLIDSVTYVNTFLWQISYFDVPRVVSVSLAAVIVYSCSSTWVLSTVNLYLH